MKHALIALIVLIALFGVPCPVAHMQSSQDFTARWIGATAATLRWSQAERGCLYRESVIGERVFAGCYEGAGAVSVTFGRVGPLSGDLRPTAGDVWVLDSDGVTSRAPLRSVGYFPVFRA